MFAYGRNVESQFPYNGGAGEGIERWHSSSISAVCNLNRRSTARHVGIREFDISNPSVANTAPSARFSEK